MGFLTVNGKLMTYDEYKNVQHMYKRHGLMQFVKLYNIHKDVQIEEENLHWGEEIEYHLYSFDEELKKVQLACDADEIMSKFSEFSDILEHFTKDEKTNDQSDVGLFGFSE